MNIGILKESKEETRVSVTPDIVDALKKIGATVLVEKGAGEQSYYHDEDYKKAGASLVSRQDVVSKSNIIVSIHLADPTTLGKMKPGSIYLGMFQPAMNAQTIQKLASKKVEVLSLDAIARITRAQSMDVLSSQATVAGYKAVLLAASHLARFFPMLTTAAGTITPASVLIIGAGVAGLQAIASSRRLGAVVDVFDTRPEVKEQVHSLGAKFVEVEGASHSAAAGGYAVEQTEEYKKRQQEAIDKYAQKADVIITTALIPGRKAPLLITKKIVDNMKSGSVVVDLASSMGGNCEYTKHGQNVVTPKGVTVIGHKNLAGSIPADASKMFSKNVLNFLKLLIKDKKINLDLNDEIISSTTITYQGEVRHKLTLDALGSKSGAAKPKKSASKK
ncbi:Re/Si-specific NAD(P)(+) transhydrogenase subunit alpha [Leptospira noguchii]|uniref:NAD(P) transhydrogenase subunit alpha part 1 n=2 Tax=Leptospira noguchii TaxID=28182 RepID=M6UHJ4_9LEPT|nr:Re/Si-specific NAD(P)(+) transhydrogenase subunit alpha [Leptospira noguchii]EKR75086.1 NAD(P)(+) transhydrogenase (B-specific) family protein [Leptospira noguchii str. 2006001870]EMO40534.1 NAD(P)(+) transhydrogenase (B-specific) family protein [Leptospira noguchii serovar Autumnalis str. ZUN142]UOG34278.1 Re/Si-specific NAD(P)(+) transhydrogenase subunit alpha [Leptospira noguchii]UOG45144.1 Re/Si-specific NAD(P)(+) transhydrogenase subunit alpha [Leptospira noguchii]UOG48806.1 Re/Si-spec